MEGGGRRGLLHQFIVQLLWDHAPCGLFLLPYLQVASGCVLRECWSPVDLCVQVIAMAEKGPLTHSVVAIVGCVVS